MTYLSFKYLSTLKVIDLLFFPVSSKKKDSEHDHFRYFHGFDICMHIEEKKFESHLTNPKQGKANKL